MAAAEGSTDMAIGNAIGSVTANIGLIMAVSLLFLPAVIQRKQFAFKGALMVGSVVLLWALCLDGVLTIVESVLVLALFAAYIVENVHTAKLESRSGAQETAAVDKSSKTLWKNIGLFVLGAVCLVAGSRLLVDNGTELAKLLGVSERIIAVTMVAIGTSLPELVTAITAIVKKQTSMSVGNILGANIIDVTVILPLCSFIGGKLTIAAESMRQTLYLDMPVCAVETLLAVVPTLIFKKFQKWQGVLMLCVYLAYLVLTVRA